MKDAHSDLRPIKARKVVDHVDVVVLGFGLGGGSDGAWAGTRLLTCTDSWFH
ncbi:hypothetical protein [Streptomyces phaeochromogenes]